MHTEASSKHNTVQLATLEVQTTPTMTNLQEGGRLDVWHQTHILARFTWQVCILIEQSSNMNAAT
jgi:hypothetical protein